jgi:pyruvate dehydrogenase E2 component (dihydrolipoamide acetyltransferase)
MATVEIKVPDIGDFDEVTVIELMVKVGDSVKAEQSLITVESDKASMEIPSSHAGVVKELKITLGDKVKEGSVVLMLDVEGATAASAAPAPAAPAPASVQAAAPVAPAVAAAVSVAGPINVMVPDIGDFKDVVVIEVMVKVGDTVKAEQSLVTVESDKASMEIPSSHAGVIKDLKVKLGDKINIGDLLAVLEGAAGAATPVAAPVAAVSVPNVAPATAALAPVATTSVAVAAVVPAHNPTALALHLPHASPSVRKFARELGVPLDEIKGSGHKGRITESDVQGFTKSVMAGAVQTKAQAANAPKAAASSGASDGGGLGLLAWPKVDFTKFGPGRAQGHVAHQEDQRRQPAPQLGHDSARHQP